MKIIIIGCGKVGRALTEQLVSENHNITVIDTNPKKIQTITEDLDVMGISGNGAGITTLLEAGVEQADILISVTGSDELNLLCCLIARKASRCQTVARVRNPMYSQEIDFIKAQMGVSMIINPELTAAREIEKLLRFPAASKIDTFANGRIYLVKLKIDSRIPLDGMEVKELPSRSEIEKLLRFPAASKIDTFANGRIYLVKLKIDSRIPLDGMEVKELPSRSGSDILVCAVEREDTVYIPDGNFVLHENDAISFVASKDQVRSFFKNFSLPIKPVQSVMIVGGGTIGYYLAKQLLKKGVRVRIVENNLERCEALSGLLPDATVIHGDGTDRHLLMEEGLGRAEAFVTLTNLDEENILLALFAKKNSKAKLISKVNRLAFDDIIEGLDVGSVIYPKYLTTDYIIQHVRSMRHSSINTIETLYRLLDNRVEALEFSILESCPVTDIPLADLKIRPGHLVCCIRRGEQVLIPRGQDSIQVGDSVIIVTLERGQQNILDILEH